MPFGLRNAGQTFQRLMDQVLAGLDFVFVYLDDILIASPDERTYQQHLRAVLEWLQEAGLVLNPEKCLFGVSAVEFLGHHITAEGGNLCSRRWQPSPISSGHRTPRACSDSWE
jgi:hypothetical protein